MARLLNQLKGHASVMSSLLDAEEAGRLASTLIFAGPTGIGKKLAAQALAQALICERKERGGCGECGPCKRVALGQSESVLQITPEGSGIKIEQSRDIVQYLSLQKLGRARIVIIDQAHVLNPQAGNALLKSLEEPPAGTYFILITPLVASLLSTIRSRAQLVRFRPLSDQDLKEVLGGEVDEWILRASQGSVELAERLLQSREDFEELEATTYAYMNAAPLRLPSEEISKLKDLLKERSAQAHAASLIQGVLRDGLRLQMGVAHGALSRGGEEIAKLTSQLPIRTLGNLSEAALMIEQDITRNVDKSLVFETFAIQLRRALEMVR